MPYLLAVPRTALDAHPHQQYHGVGLRGQGKEKYSGTLSTETSALMMVFGILAEKHLKRRKVRMRAEDIAWIEEVTKLLAEEPIRPEFPEEALVT
jgi:hypothetical protein